jgi:hypothetical protein
LLPLLRMFQAIPNSEARIPFWTGLDKIWTTRYGPHIFDCRLSYLLNNLFSLFDITMEEMFERFMTMATGSDEEIIARFNMDANEAKNSYCESETQNRFIFTNTSNDVNKPITSKKINKSCLRPITFEDIVLGVNRGTYLKVNITASLLILVGISTIIRDSKGLIHSNIIIQVLLFAYGVYSYYYVQDLLVLLPYIICYRMNQVENNFIRKRKKYFIMEGN